MKTPTRCLRVFMFLLAFLGIAHGENPVKLATAGRIDLMPDDQVGRLINGRVS